MQCRQKTFHFRMLLTAKTDEIRLYGLNKKDRFDMTSKEQYTKALPGPQYRNSTGGF